jgi:hypothetical protein
MKFFIPFFLFFSFAAFGSLDTSEIVCFSDMTDGVCQVTESKDTLQGQCVIEVNVQFKNGKKELLILTGTGSVRKHQVVLFLEAQQKDQAISLAYSSLYRQIVPFLSIETCR